MNLTYRLLNERDLAAIQAVQADVCAALDDPAILQPLSVAELLNILRGNGVMLGVFSSEQLVAFRALLKPAVDEDEHLGADVGATDFTRVLYQEISNVHPDVRGQGLQKLMASWIMDKVDSANFDWICATVMPYNIASLKDKFAQGMYVYALKLKYGGKLRYVFGKNLRDERIFGEEMVQVSMRDTETQQQLLANGFVGVSMEALEGDWFVTYRK
ncbi:GNAT family N-acetyltransferase [Lysinibacillus sp. KU-BSD001]|uniref:GNAT family N-acetyltransferase n=1 Tax=Lysinibacillus sp. KU-BSD001 TaxID=3141328 RepID=UPI0036E4C2A5